MLFLIKATRFKEKANKILSNYKVYKFNFIQLMFS
jgi:hypothetical protein